MTQFFVLEGSTRRVLPAPCYGHKLLVPPITVVIDSSNPHSSPTMIPLYSFGSGNCSFYVEQTEPSHEKFSTARMVPCQLRTTNEPVPAATRSPERSLALAVGRAIENLHSKQTYGSILAHRPTGIL